METTEKNYEADNRTGLNHEGRIANMPLSRLTATSIIGDAVENPQGEKLGTIDNLMVNLITGEVEYVVLQFGEVLGVGGKLFAIPFSELKLKPNEKAFIISRDKEYLKKAPGFDKTHWPATNEHTYFDDVKLYYGSYVPPFP
jgi:sporulation protein YlmC with PRC-barrel domain